MLQQQQVKGCSHSYRSAVAGYSLACILPAVKSGWAGYSYSYEWTLLPANPRWAAYSYVCTLPPEKSGWAGCWPGTGLEPIREMKSRTTHQAVLVQASQLTEPLRTDHWPKQVELVHGGRVEGKRGTALFPYGLIDHTPFTVFVMRYFYHLCLSAADCGSSSFLMT